MQTPPDDQSLQDQAEEQEPRTGESPKAPQGQESPGDKKPPKQSFRRKCPSCEKLVSVKANRCPECDFDISAHTRRVREEQQEELEGKIIGEPERKVLDGSMIGGVGLMVVAAIWFVVGWYGGRIFFYPPILFAVGFVGFVRGVARTLSPPAEPRGERRRRGKPGR